MNTGAEVLIVEDDWDLADVMRDALQGEGYGVTHASNGSLALERLRAASELPGLILLDLMMPVMDGAQLLEALRKDARLASLPVVLVTADGHAESKAVKVDADAGIKKPVELGELLATVAKYCSHH